MKLLACEICGNANNYCAECGTCFKCSAEDHEQQLQQVRKEAAMAVLDTIADCRFELPDFIIEMVKSKYGLEGVRDE